jgi:hypothetical protein
MCLGKLFSDASMVFESAPKKVNKNIESKVESGVKLIVI